MEIRLDLVQQCEDLVRAGKIDEARKVLSELEPARLPRSLRLPLANLCRRTDLLRLGLKVLSPLVHAEKGKWQTTATPQELAEYAVLLQKHGAVREALWTLKQVDSKAAPEAALYLAFCHFNNWDYGSAIEALENHGRLETRPYQKLIGKLNLALAFVAAGRLSEAHSALDELMAAAKAASYLRLLANSHELRAQVLLKSGDMSAAKASLEQARQLVQANPALDNSLIRKWSAVIEGLETQNEKPLLKFREEAVAEAQWENVRESDRHLLKIKFDQDTFNSLMFGSPYPAYRAAVEAELGRKVSVQSLILGKAGAPVFDLSSGEMENAPSTYERPSPKIHSLIEILLRDFFRPMAIGGLFAELFPGEYFDPQSSLHRVHQVVYRARGWIEKTQIPIEIRETDGKYSLAIIGELGIRVPYNRVPVHTEMMRLELLRNAFGDGFFSSREAAAALGISTSSLKAWLTWAISENRVTRVGAGSRIRYRIQTESSALAA